MHRWLIVCLLPLYLLAPPVFAEPEESVVREVLAILHSRGIVDDAEYVGLTSRQERWEAQQEDVPGIEWSGDFRARYEQFWFDEDSLGFDLGNRSRARYRLRLQGKARINPWASATFRLASGGAVRSANQTLGRRADFDPDGLFIDRAHLDLTAPEGFGPLGGRTRLRLGKMGVPFRWKHGPDSMLWDRDISVEGAALSWDSASQGETAYFVRAAYLIADENATSRDPHVIGLQAGATLAPAEGWELGGRVTHYEWRSLDSDFLDRSTLAGNQPLGLNGSANGGTGVSATEFAAYARWDAHEDWPVLLYSHLLRNHDAEDQDLAYGVGIQLGDKRRVVQLKAGYFRVEANAWPGRFVDSPLLAGRANQQVYVAQAIREVLQNTDLELTLFVGNPVETGSAFNSSLFGSERILLQTDLIVRF
ncbi:MAG: putative porin [Deltaproteobacteria bacterium]|nr:putative porin [Deltaproteobacteria bacterium]